MRLEHIGIAVADAQASANLLKDLLGLDVYKIEDVESESVSTRFLSDGRVKLELVEPTSPDAALGRYLEKYGEGLHHLAFEVDNIDDTIARLKNRGYRILSDAPYDGADGKSVFFVHPRDTNHILFEFCQSTRPVTKTETFALRGDVDQGSVTCHTAGNAQGPVLLISGFAVDDPIVGVLEPSMRLVFIPEDLVVTESSAHALAGDTDFSLLITSDQLSRLADQASSIDPAKTVVVTTSFEVDPAHLPAGDVHIVAESNEMDAESAGLMSKLLDRDGVSISVMDTGTSIRARRLFGDALAVYLTSHVEETVASGK